MTRPARVDTPRIINSDGRDSACAPIVTRDLPGGTGDTAKAVLPGSVGQRT